MHSASLLRGVAATILLALACSAQEAAPHRLRYTFSTGATGHYVMRQGGDITAAMGDQTIEMTSHVALYFTYEVKSVTEDGTAVVAQTCTRVQGTLNNPMMGEIDFDSTDEDADAGPLDAMLDLIDQTITIHVDARGAVTKTEIPSAARSAVSAGLNLEESFGQMIPQLPEQPVAVGGEWNSKMSNTMGQLGKATVDVKNRLVAVKGNDVSIAQTLQFSFDASPAQAEVDVKKGEIQAAIDLSQPMPRLLDGKILMAVNQPMEMEMDITLGLARTEHRAGAAREAAKDDKDGKEK